MSHPCTACNEGWTILDGERFCGFCGALALRVELQLLGMEFLYFEDLQEKDYLETVARVRNTGSIAVPLSSYRVELDFAED